METITLSDVAQDEQFMQRAIAVGNCARLLSPPNPWVGCVIVKNGHVIGEGFTQKPGDAHAEIEALRRAGISAEGATMYVTLEPCSHFGRTPPCVDAVIKAKPARVVIALRDPDPNVNGKGIESLKQAGVPVTIGVCSKDASESLAPYVYHRRTNKAYCLIKTAMSIDGRIAAADHSSQWITTPEGRKDAHRLRSESQAILVGSGTALADNPQLTVRESVQPAKAPLRVVLDAKGRMNRQGVHLLDSSLAATLVLTTEKCPRETLNLWDKAGVEFEILPAGNDGTGVDFSEAMVVLGKRQILQVLVEGGATLHGSIIKDSLFQKMLVYVGPRLLGDGGIPVFKNLPIANIRESPRLQLLHAERVGENIRLEYGAFNEDLL